MPCSRICCISWKSKILRGMSVRSWLQSCATAAGSGVKYKDVVEELEPIAGYCGTAAGMQAVKQLSRFVGELRKVENYHQNRHYVPRSGRVKGESQDAE